VEVQGQVVVTPGGGASPYAGPAVMVVDESGVIADCSPDVERLLGVATEQSVGRSVTEVLGLADGTAGELAERLLQRAPYDWAVPAAADGSRGPLTATLVPLRVSRAPGFMVLLTVDDERGDDRLLADDRAARVATVTTALSEALTRARWRRWCWARR
jgi:PAS domain S-box-containing protein